MVAAYGETKGGRGRQNGWLPLCGAQPQNFGAKKWCQNTPGSNGQEETSPDPLLLTIKVTSFKNKLWRN
jgi:hypothetical protein